MNDPHLATRVHVCVVARDAIVAVEISDGNVRQNWVIRAWITRSDVPETVPAAVRSTAS